MNEPLLFGETATRRGEDLCRSCTAPPLHVTGEMNDDKRISQRTRRTNLYNILMSREQPLIQNPVHCQGIRHRRMKVGPPPDEEDGRERQRGRDSTPLHLAERKEERKMTPPTHLKSDCALHRGIRGVITRKSRDLYSSE